MQMYFHPEAYNDALDYLLGDILIPNPFWLLFFFSVLYFLNLSKGRKDSRLCFLSLASYLLKTNVNMIYFPLAISQISSRIPRGPLVPIWKYKVDLKWMQIEYLFPLNTIYTSDVVQSVNKKHVPDILFPKGLIFVICSK